MKPKTNMFRCELYSICPFVRLSIFQQLAQHFITQKLIEFIDKKSDTDGHCSDLDTGLAFLPGT